MLTRRLLLAWLLIASAGRVMALDLTFFARPRTSLTEHGSAEPAWSSDGSFIAYSGEIGPDPTRIVGDVLRAATLQGELLAWFDLTTDRFVNSPTWSPDGSRIAYVDDSAPREGGIWIADASGESPTRLTGYFRWWMELAWAPSGNTIAVTSRDTVWLVSTIDGSLSPLRTDGVMDAAPAWSPDGRFLAFSSQRSGNEDLWVLDTSTSELRQLTLDAADDRDPTWSPDGRWIAFASNRSGDVDLWAIPSNCGGAIQLTNDPFWDGSPAWSPLGDKIAFTSTRPSPDPYDWGATIWIASDLPGEITSVARRSWSELKRTYR